MANQIARNMAVKGFDAAARSVADHMTAFWDPRMKAQLLAMNDPLLNPIATAALGILRRELPGAPDHSTAPIEQGASDAG
ncbi:formate dehydrogenase subunit delta [Sphingobium sp. Sx8-8]|uniref:formate dehydrogenase subunit delta n=1 Tax=Sphingobium sp. Sx8-8 TaxID=2933617 RepID=UPI001F579B4C|nr:formate dehydrogenase subunit delta [Sphingobium sp. Sx8-8]